MTRLRVLAFVLAVFAAAVPAAAQSFSLPAGSAVDHAGAFARLSIAGPDTQAPPARRPAAARPPRAKVPIGVRAFFLVDIESMTAKESFKAVLDSSQMMGFGAGVDITNLYQGLFFRFALASMSADGERVFVDDNDVVHSLNNQITVKVMPLELGAGWRFGAAGRKQQITPYVGGGLLFQSYKETSELAINSEDVSERFNGYTVFGGVDVAVGKFLSVGAEGFYRTVPNAIGEGGVSEHFKETDLGGLGVRFMVGIRK